MAIIISLTAILTNLAVVFMNSDVTIDYKVNLKKAEMPRGYAKDLAKKLNVPTHKVYHVRNGYVKDRRIHLELLRMAAIHDDEQTTLNIAINNIEKRMSAKNPTNQLSMF